MALKRWIFWLCIVALVVTELLLFRANQQRDAALADAHDARQQIEELRAKLDEGKTTGAEAQNTEIARLRSENQDLLRLRNEIRLMTVTNQQLAAQLKATRATAQQQEEQLQAWQAEALAAQQAQRAAAVAAQQQAQQQEVPAYETIVAWS